MVVGSIPFWDQDGDQKILLCRRAIEPRLGFWTLPAGFMENNETTSEAAARETLEEAGANIEMQELYTMLNVPHVQQVHLFYRARLLDLNFSAGTESLEVKLFSESDIPWEDLAFPTVSKTLKLFFADLAAQKNPQSLARTSWCHEVTQIPQLCRKNRRFRFRSQRIPFVDPKIGVIVFAAASLLKDIAKPHR
jgi:ADP-ribose pyrophosphatase YjhB (NUDIX family)